MTERIADLAADGRVHRRLFSDPEIFAVEMERIFGRSWLYVGHESQLTGPGDFVEGYMGTRSVIVARHTDGSLRVFANRCTHRGMRVCSARRGSRLRFVCPYHGWTFATDGALVDIPNRKGGGGKVAPGDPALALAPAARVGSYRGFVFANAAPDGPPLVACLEPIAEAIDNLIDRAPADAVAPDGAMLRQRCTGNWKLHADCADDFAQATFAAPAQATAAAPAQATVAAAEPVGAAPTPAGASADAAYLRAMTERRGVAGTTEILSPRARNRFLYPNLIVVPESRQIHVLQPVSVDCTVVHSASFRLAGAPEATNRQAARALGARYAREPRGPGRDDGNGDGPAASNALHPSLHEGSGEWIPLPDAVGGRPFGRYRTWRCLMDDTVDDG